MPTMVVVSGEINNRRIRMKKLLLVLAAFAMLVAACGPTNSETQVTSPEVVALQTQLAEKIAAATVQAQITELEAAIAAVGATQTSAPVNAVAIYPTGTPVLDDVLTHTAYFTDETLEEDFPYEDLSSATIASCHSPEGANGEVTAIFLIRGYVPFTKALIAERCYGSGYPYVNIYTGYFSAERAKQIDKEVTASIRPGEHSINVTYLMEMYFP